jgi:molybdopterin-guanine dinucleotide biosynthesis protein A
MQTAAFVLAGGRSSRMGQNKALLSSGAHLLIEEVAAKLVTVAGNVALVGPPDRFSHLPLDCLPDLRPGCGPLGGIEAALASGRGEYNLIVACDMPGIRTGWLEALLQSSKDTGALCVAIRDGIGQIHPLCAVYRSTCLPFVRSALDSGHLKLLEMLEELKAITIDIGEKLWNLNTPEDWNAWECRQEEPIWSLIKDVHDA